MPRTSATRCASRASSGVQQPLPRSRTVWPFASASARWTPVTSCPASTARAAATAESTPPDIAARILIALGPLVPLVAGGRDLAGPASAVHHRRQRLEQGGDIGPGRGVAQREAQG